MAQSSLEQRLLRPIVLTRPVRLVEPNSWVTHVPFAFWLVDTHKPRVIVELGTHSGNSYAALAQAVQIAGLDTSCYAVDSWIGDEQAGYYGEDVFREWSTFHDLHFASFSRLVRATFDEALVHFADGSIDLLHIDGLHTYEAVRHDFESWRQKLSSRAVVLFHDVNVREGDFGVWRYWDELRAAFPSFTFHHGHGLGVLAVGSELSDDVSWLVQLARDGDDALRTVRFFSAHGDTLRLQLLADARLVEASAASGRIRDLGAALAQAEAALAANTALVTSAHSAAIAAYGEVTGRLVATVAERDAALGALDEVKQGAEEAKGQARRAKYQAAARERHIRALIATLQQSRAESDTFEQQVRFNAAEQRQHRRRPVPASRFGRARARLRDAEVTVGGVCRRPLQSAQSLARLRHLGYRQAVAQLAASGLFDQAYYRASAGVGAHENAVARFLLRGDAAGESSHPLFDPVWYRESYPDLGAAAPLRHYLSLGGWEYRSPHPLFDPRHYVAQWPASSLTAPTPLSHYVLVGAFAGASPHPLFDTRHVLAQRPEIGIAGVDPLLHFLRVGAVERLDPHPLFSASHYHDSQPDLAGENPLVHFVRRGAGEGRSPHPLFDIGFYWEQRPDVLEHGGNALLHYLHSGVRENVDPHPLFDVDFYLEQTVGLLDVGGNPLVHYLRWGWRDGLSPSPWFNPQYYQERYPDLRGVNPLLHFVQHGWREHRDPSPEFSVAGYLQANPDVAASGIDPLTHFVRHGLAEGRTCGLGPMRPAREAKTAVLRVSGRTNGVPTVLCVSHVSPWPVRAGNEYRLSRMLRHFQTRGFRIVLVLAPIDSEPPAPGTLERLAEDLGNVVLCQPNGRVEHRLRDVPDVLSNLSGLPIVEAPDSVLEPGDRAFCHDTVHAVALALSRAIGPAVVLAEYIFMTRIFLDVGAESLRVLDTIDVFSQKGSNVVAYGINDAGVPPDMESRMAARADVIVAIHPTDAATLQLMPHGREVIVTGVDADVRTERPWPAQPVALIPGSSNALNMAGLRDFLRFAWPRVRTLVPGAMLRVAGGVGRSVAPGTPGVTVLGHVPDLTAEYESARVVINPAVAGTGLKIKTIEALAHLTPVVGWSHNRDGLSDDFAAFVDEARDWQDFADAVATRLLASQSPFGEAVIRTIARELSGETIYRALDERIDRYFRSRTS